MGKMGKETNRLEKEAGQRRRNTREKLKATRWLESRSPHVARLTEGLIKEGKKITRLPAPLEAHSTKHAL